MDVAKLRSRVSRIVHGSKRPRPNQSNGGGGTADSDESSNTAEGNLPFASRGADAALNASRQRTGSVEDNKAEVHSIENASDQSGPTTAIPRKTLPDDAIVHPQISGENDADNYSLSHLQDELNALGIDPEKGVQHDTTVHQTVAEPVVHETVREEHHEIRQEVITRDIHRHHVVHRILPIIQTEYLPARHFVLDADGNKVEVAEADVQKALGLV